MGRSTVSTNGLGPGGLDSNPKPPGPKPLADCIIPSIAPLLKKKTPCRLIQFTVDTGNPKTTAPDMCERPRVEGRDPHSPAAEGCWFLTRLARGGRG